MPLSRRALLGGTAGALGGLAGGAALVEHDVLPGRPLAHELLGLNGDAGHVPDVEVGRRQVGVLPSRLVDTDPGWVLLHPPGSSPGDALPAVVVLHGARSTAESWCDDLGLAQFLAASERKLVIAAVDGGLSSYWHRRADGQDAGAMVLEEFVPFLRERGLDPQGFWGWSMGGFGALALSATEEGRRLGGAVAVSPALWPDYDDASPDAFDSRSEYGAGMALVAGQRPWTRVDCGTGDPFWRNDQQVLDGLDAETHWSPGAHDEAYWTRVAPGQLAWLADRVSAA